MSIQNKIYAGDSVSSEDEWYRVNQEIGSTGDSVVYMVTQTSGQYRGNNFALKLFHNIENEDRIKRFQEERKLLQNVNHPSILRYYDQGKYDDYPFLISEFLPETLQDVIDEDSVPLQVKLGYAVQLLSALIYLEKQSPPVVHRDIKPSNVFVRGTTCYLGDFGLMKRIDNSTGSVLGSFESGDIAMNKWEYRTPDLVEYERDDRDDIPVESDVFQLGLVLIELFTENNWNPQTPSEDPLSDVNIDNRAHTYIDGIHGGVGDGIGKLLSDMINEDPEKRPKASDIMDDWMGLYEDVADASVTLNGEVFT